MAVGGSALVSRARTFYIVKTALYILAVGGAVLVLDRILAAATGRGIIDRVMAGFRSARANGAPAPNGRPTGVAGMVS